jgi:hypothetical protein
MKINPLFELLKKENSIMIKKKMLSLAAALGLAAVSLPYTASAGYVWGDSYGDRGLSAIVGTGCHYSAYNVITQYVWGLWPAALWHSNACNARWGSFNVGADASQSWRPAKYVTVGLAGGAVAGYNYYYTGPGYYFSPMRYSQATTAIATCGAVSFGSLGVATNCSYYGP